MSDELNSLIASTYAISDSTEDVYLLEQKENVEQALTRKDPAHVLDTSKSLLATLFKTILLAKLRNDFGSASHGKDGQFENPIQMPEAEMVARIVDGVVAFLYRRHKESKDRKLATRVSYDECADFNDWFDEEREAVAIKITDGNQLLFLASEVLFNTDRVAYREAFLEFLSWQEDEAKDEAMSLETSAFP